MRYFLFTIIMIVFSLNSYCFAKEVTLKEKIGQMLIIGFNEAEVTPNSAIVKLLNQQKIGGVILNDPENIQNPQQIKQLTEDLQFYTKAAAKHYTNDLYPLFIGVDYEGGKVNRLKEKNGFPKTYTAFEAAQLPPADLINYADQMAKTLKNLGINFNFAPVVDVNVNPDSPIIGKFERSFSENPYVVKAIAGVFGRAFQRQGIICSYKHFPGHGSSTEDTHKGFVDVTYTWKELELIPYTQMKFAKDCPVIMTAHVVNYNLDSKGLPATLSQTMLTDLLREKLKFKGLIITDDMQMKAITDKYGWHESTRLAINAGADILMFANQLETYRDPTDIINAIYEDVQSGKIKESRIHDAFTRIMRLKGKLPK